MAYPYKLTVFTPTYNRAVLLKKLYESLLNQVDTADFEWLIIDDNSSDNTPELVHHWIKEDRININYIRLKKNGGKPRAINVAVYEARSSYLFIVDSDDYLVDGIIPFIINEIEKVDKEPNINAVGVMRLHGDGRNFASPTFKDYMDATNLERDSYGLAVDCNEAYKTAVLKNYPFKVWDGENFTPEETVLNAMALDGYKVRWLNKAGVIADYQEKGLTKDSWNLQKKNPMGYAMLYDFKMRYQKTLRHRIYNTIQMTAQCFLGRHPEYMFRSNAPILSVFLIPLSFMLYLRRLWQYRSV